MRFTATLWLVLASAAAALGQAKQDPKPATPAEKPKPGGKTEKIQVHGHWVIEVRNPDGTLAQRKEFENSLYPGEGSGETLLSWIFTGVYVPGPMTIEIYTAAGVLVIGQTAGICSFYNSRSYTYCYSTLQMSPSGGQVVLQGTAVSPVATTINQVASLPNYCGNNLSPQACLGTDQPLITLATLTSATTSLSVNAGQTIAVTVIFSFM